MKIQLVWLMVVIFTLFSNGYAELSIQEENLTYREELITFINEQEQELLDSAREIFEHRLPEYASEPFRFLYKGIIINNNKKPSQPTLKRRFFKKKAAFFSWPGLGKEWC